jgi:cilia- and flagella-associated protein 57
MVLGHTGKIKSICWASDDSRIITAGGEGAIYEWNLRDMSNHQGIGIKRDFECILKTCSYTSVCMSYDKKTIFAVGNDKSVKEIFEGKMKREIQSDQILTQICLSNSGKVLAAGTENGNIRVFKYPFNTDQGLISDIGSFQEHVAHIGPITQLKISFDDQYLFSAGEDGSLYIFRISDKDHSLLKKKEKDSFYADEVLVTKPDLEEKNAIINSLKTRFENLKMENDNQLCLKDVNFDEKIKQVTEKFIQEIETLKINATVLKTDKEKEIQRHIEDMEATRKTHAKDLEDMENSQNTKLTLEYQKIEGLERSTANQQAAWELLMKEMQVGKDKALQELNFHFDGQLREKQQEMDMLREEIRRQCEEYEELCKETEEDADRELTEIRHKFEKRCREERETVTKLKAENAIMKKKYNSLQAEIDSNKAEIAKLNGEEKRMFGVIKNLENDISGMKSEVKLVF